MDKNWTEPKKKNDCSVGKMTFGYIIDEKSNKKIDTNVDTKNQP